jgi:hypothetical protein
MKAMMRLDKEKLVTLFNQSEITLLMVIFYKYDDVEEI